jgi:hypothetical protein
MRTSDKKTPCGDPPSGAFLLPDHQRLQGGETASTGKKRTGTSNAGPLQNTQLTKSIKCFPKKCSVLPVRKAIDTGTVNDDHFLADPALS